MARTPTSFVGLGKYIYLAMFLHGGLVILARKGLFKALGLHSLSV